MIIKIILLVIGLFILVILGLSGYLINNIVYNKKKSKEHLENFHIETFSSDWYKKINDWYDKVSRRYFKIQSDYGYKLDCYEITNNKKKYVILLHGVTTNKEFVKKFAYMYNKLGYSIIAMDHKSHGKSGSSIITYGYYEKYDLEKLIMYIKEQKGEDCIIGLHGESMGASILLSYASMVQDNCQFYIADCPYENFYTQIRNNVIKKINFPKIITKLIMETTNILLRLLFSFNMKEIDIINHIHSVKNPILFLNAKDDDYIDPSMTRNLFNKSQGKNKRIHWFETGFHAGSFNYQPDEYIKVVTEFLKEFVE